MRRTVSLWLLALSLHFSGCNTTAGPLRSLTILHTNDLHARFLPDERGRGGFAHLATAIKREREKSETAIVLLAGDLVQGTPVSSIYEGVPCYEVAGAMGFDANVLGNHEFDYSWRKIPEFFAAANFPTVTANVVNKDGELLAPAAYVILERNGLRIAVIGVLMEDLDRVTKGNQRGPWHLLPAAATVRKYARQLRADVDFVVVLGHLFDDEEREILEGVPEIDVLIGGHNHRGQTEPDVVDGRIGVKVRANGTELGRLDLEIDTRRRKVASHRWRVIPILASDFPANPPVQKLVRKWEQKVASVVDVPIGRAARDFDRGEVVELIEQAMMDAVGADLAYMNVGGTRDNLYRGEILVRHVWQILPFGNQLVHARIQGRELPSEFRKGRNINPNQTYTVVTNDFIAEQIRRRGAAAIAAPGPLVREALIDYIKQRQILK